VPFQLNLPMDKEFAAPPPNLYNLLLYL
jgi:hypothetical protein